MGADDLKDAPKDSKFPVNSQQHIWRIFTYIFVQLF